jgi:poly-gamma-glutamate capsule biosynthesis protein CapA/YwtB (metallophosphatase superfamily)
MLQGFERVTYGYNLRCGVIGCVFSGLISCSSESGSTLAGTGECGGEQSTNELRLFLAGDAIIVRPWSQVEDPAFLALVDQIRDADVAIANLETIIHDFKGYAQQDAGGTYMASPSEIASELTWAGFDMVAHANNHTFDYGSIGVLENLENVETAGLKLAGSGKDLQHARAPAFFHSPRGTVALVSTTSTYTPYGRASISRPELPGRPGVNPLEVLWEWNIEALSPLKITVPTRAKVDAEDLAGNLDSVRSARKHADLVVFSIHAHERDGAWLRKLAHQVIDAGADVFFAHGPHAVDGIEIYHCRPILYGLGDFVFQQEQITRLPPEYYEELGLKGDTPWEALQRIREEKRGPGPYGRQASHEGLGAIVNIGNKGVTGIRLIPVDLGYDEDIPIRGRPRIADPKLGQQILSDVGERSRPYGTAIEYRSSENIGVVRIR